MSNPSLLILDEPSLGLAPKLVSEIFGIVKEINARGVTVLLVEQNVYRGPRYFHPCLRSSNGPHSHGGERAGIAEERSSLERHTSVCERRTDMNN